MRSVKEMRLVNKWGQIDELDVPLKLLGVRICLEDGKALIYPSEVVDAFVNEEKVAGGPQALEPGDFIRVGGQRYFVIYGIEAERWIEALREMIRDKAVGELMSAGT